MPMAATHRFTVKTGKTAWTNIDNAHPERATAWKAAAETVDTDDQATHDALQLNPKFQYTGTVP